MSQVREAPLGLIPGYSTLAIAKGYAAKLSGTGADQVAKCSANSDLTIGVVQNAIPALGYGSIATAGMVKALAGDTVARLDEVEVDATGRFVPITTGRGIGIANSAAAEGEEFELYMHGPGGITALGAGAIQERTVTVGHADLTAAAVSEVIAIGAVLPDNALVLGVGFEDVTAFSGGSVSNLLLDIGTTGDADAVRDGVNLFSALVDGQPSTAPAGIAPTKFFPSSVQLNATFIATGDNVVNLSAGAVTIRVAFVVLPA